jgi:hypothetical protein
MSSCYRNSGSDPNRSTSAISAGSEIQKESSFIVCVQILRGAARVALRACLFGLWLAGCAGKAAVQRKLLCRESCCSELNCLATWLAG